MKQSGIYEIRNTANGKRYIGQAVNIADRWKTHRADLKRGSHHSIHMQRSWNTHGAAAFQFLILEVCAPEELTPIEQRYLDTVRPEYNSDPVAGSRRGAKLTPEQCARHSAVMKRRWAEDREGMLRAVAGSAWKNKTGHTAETKQKISAAKKGRPRLAGAGERTGAALRGRPRPQEVRDKISAAQRGVPRCRPSEEIRVKLRAAQTARRIRERYERVQAC